jgi:Family of unknown function (DUF6314)
VFERLLGDWTLVREIPGYATATGVARVFPIDAQTARYEEVVRISLMQGETLNGTQCYLYRRHPQAPAEMRILFCRTAELFQALAFQQRGGAWQASARFVCGADQYDSEYALGPEWWEIRHTVRGPRKDYRIETVYRRAGDGASARAYFFNAR